MNTVIDQTTEQKGNERRMPTGIEFTQDKNINDLLYAMLQANSKWNPEEKTHRYIAKRDIKKAAWARTLGIGRTTLYAKIEYLLSDEVGLLVDAGDYYLLPNKGDFYFLVPLETLNFLIGTTRSDVIKVYTHLGSLFRTYGDQAFFTENRLLEITGHATNKPSNHKNVQYILTTLVNNGLIKFKRDTYNGKPIYRLVEVSKEYKKSNELQG